jgi:Tfp pilus assembly protein PilO
MIRFLIPIFLLASSAGLFFLYIDPTYQTILELRAQEAQFNEALNRSRELQQARDTLLSRYNTFSQSDVDRLTKLLPDNVDNVRLILDIDGIASKYNMRTRNVTVTDSSSDDSNAIGTNQGPVGSVVLNFSVTATYDNFTRFIKDLESSLRIVDLVGLSFTSEQGDAYDFDVSLRTYWLK